MELKSSIPELLLQLADKSGLDLVEVLELSEGDEDDDSLAATTDLELLGGGDVQITKISLQLIGRHLEIKDQQHNAITRGFFVILSSMVHPN
jgi:hypothetical protein